MRDIQRSNVCLQYQVTPDKHHLAQSSMCSQYQHSSLNEPFMCTKPRFNQTVQPVAECQPSVHAQSELARKISTSSICEPELGHNEMSRLSNLSEMNCHRENFSLDLDMCDHSACDPLDSVLERLKEESQYRNDASILLGVSSFTSHSCECAESSLSNYNLLVDYEQVWLWQEEPEIRYSCPISCPTFDLSCWNVLNGIIKHSKAQVPYQQCTHLAL